MLKLIDIIKRHFFSIYVLVRFIARIFIVRLRMFPKRVSDIYYSLFYYESFSLLNSCHLTIGVKTLCKSQTIFPHPVGIVIGQGVQLGMGCVIYQNVTLGLRNIDSIDYPTIGNNVKIYAGASIFGPVNIGDNTIIGAGCLITKNIPANAIVTKKDDSQKLSIRVQEGMANV